MVGVGEDASVVAVELWVMLGVGDNAVALGAGVNAISGVGEAGKTVGAADEVTRGAQPTLSVLMKVSRIPKHIT